MENARRFYIDGAWVDPVSPAMRTLIDPANEEPFAEVALGCAEDVDRAVAAARAAFPSYSRTGVQDRAALLRRVVEVYKTREDEIARTLSREMGAPLRLAKARQAPLGAMQFAQTAEVLERYAFSEQRGTTLVVKEPIGVCGLIAPWNWPLNIIACKVAPALAAGCTVVLKPSELAPLNAVILAEVLHEAGVPKGVFNLVQGEGVSVGQAIAAHPGIDMVSFTGSTRAGVLVAMAAAGTVKRVHQELGGKSPNIILPDADLERAVTLGVAGCFVNSGQTCVAPTRMLVSADQHGRAVEIALAAAEANVVGDPMSETTTLGPVVSRGQFDRVQNLIAAGIREGATLATGGPGRPADLARGYYVRPTVFGGVRSGMTIAREEIFGPVLSILPYETEDEAIALANDTAYGLAAYVQSADLDRARRVASRLRAGQVYLNYAPVDLLAPMGGYKQSGNGREYGEYGLEAYLEIKAVVGYASGA